VITLIGAFIERKPKALNTLGLTLIIELLIEPYHLFHIGFQLSFLCTAALITISPSLGRSLSALFPKIESDALKNLSLLQKIGYLISTYIKTALTACLAVHLVTIPVCLYYSGSFPLFSLIYNLFFPLLAMVCMCIFLTGLLMMIIPPIGSYLLIFSGKLTALALKITEHPPLKVEWHLYLKNISSTKLVLYLFFIFLFVSWKRQKDQYGSLLSCHSLNKKQRNS
jgi:competence protein ComEC